MPIRPTKSTHDQLKLAAVTSMLFGQKLQKKAQTAYTKAIIFIERPHLPSVQRESGNGSWRRRLRVTQPTERT